MEESQVKFTLVFTIHNKEYHLESVLNSWLRRLSGKHTYEVIVVCDGCADDSVSEARRVMLHNTDGDGFTYDNLIQWVVVETPDVFEIKANNVALGMAAKDSDLIVFIQDDNWIFDDNWDDLVVQARAKVDRPGALALLAGNVFKPNKLDHCRVETRRRHKMYMFDRVNSEDIYPPALYEVDFVTRPFVVETKRLLGYGGLGGPEFERLCFDDVDLCLKLQKDGYRNLYLALDILNTAAGQDTAPQIMRAGYEHNRDLVMPRYASYLQWRDVSPFRQIAPLYMNGKGVQFDKPDHDL